MDAQDPVKASGPLESVWLHFDSPGSGSSNANDCGSMQILTRNNDPSPPHPPKKNNSSYPRQGKLFRSVDRVRLVSVVGCSVRRGHGGGGCGGCCGCGFLYVVLKALGHSQTFPPVNCPGDKKEKKLRYLIDSDCPQKIATCYRLY